MQYLSALLFGYAGTFVLILEIVLFILGIYTLILLIKALKKYLKS